MLPGKSLGEVNSTFPRDPNSPMWVIFVDFRAQCRYYLYTCIPRDFVEASASAGIWGVVRVMAGQTVLGNPPKVCYLGVFWYPI